MPREARAASNERIIREVNERIRGLEESLRNAGPDYRASFICECANLGCTSLISASIDEYETVRERPRQFLVLPDHLDPNLERVVDKTDRFVVVEKLQTDGS